MSSKTPRTPSSPTLIVVTLSFCGVIVALMQTLIAPLLPSVPRLAHTTPSTASWLVTATLIAGCVANPVFGRMGDMYGKRKMIVVSLLALTVGSVLCGLTSSIEILIIGRALQGAGLAVIPLGMSILRDELPPERVPSAVATVSATLGTGAAIGYPAAAFLVEYANWHTMFWVSAAVGLLDLFLVLRFVPETPTRTKGRFDFPGTIGLSATLITLLVGVEKGSSWGWTSDKTIAFFLVALVVGLAWGRFEYNYHSPLVDLRISAQPAVLLTNLAALAIGFSFYANSLSTAQLVQEPKATGYGLGASIVIAGLCVLPGGAAMAVLSPVTALIARRRGPKTALGLASGVLFVGYIFRVIFSSSLWPIVIGTSIISCGTALGYSALSLLIMRAVPISETGAANGLNTLMRSIGQSICSAVVATVLASSTIRLATGEYPTLHAYKLVFVIAGVVALIALGLTLMIPGRKADAAVTRQAEEILAAEPA